MIAKYLWKYFKKDLLKFYVSEQGKPVGFAELEYRMTDSNGKKYYGFGKNMSMPVLRFGKLQEYIMWMSAGLTGAELDKLIDVADKAVFDGLGNPKNAAKVGSILYQIRERKGMVLHHELLINFISVQLVREDESITDFDNDIHMEKVDQFLLDTKTNPLFFFQLPELNKLWHLLKMSADEWKLYWSESELQQKALLASLKMYQQESELKTSATNKSQK
jgi:hypothetical protein